MKEPSSKYQPKLWLLLLPVALLIALGLGLLVRGGGVVRLEQLARPETARPHALAAGGEAKLSESLLTDSILSIVQSYYVDPARVDNRALLRDALASLAGNPRIKAAVTAGSVWVEVDGDRRIFPLKAEPRYQDVLDVYSGVATMLDEAGIKMPAEEEPGKNANGSVTLLNGMLAELDAHSTLLSPDAYRELRQGTDGSFGGLGVLVGIRDNLLTVIKPLPRSPAQRAGIMKHDRILAIGGRHTYGHSLDDLVEYMRGDPGTAVHLSLLREGARAPSDVLLRREIIHVDSVTPSAIGRGGLKVLRLVVDCFASRTSHEVLSAIKKFRRQNHGVMDGLVLDLRGNPGGLLDQAVQMADLFLEKGVIVTTKGRREEVETAGSGFDEVGFPIVVLVDGDSASASEIVAGALQDHGRAVVVGQPSFGKGSVQTIFELPGDRALKLTIARYYTPSGRSIQNVGIMPDVWLQPVAKAATNENLFGSYRYKNERFLHAHLGSDVAAAGVKTDLFRHPVVKTYYLADHVPSMDSDDFDDRPLQKDEELATALQIISKVHATYGDLLPEGTRRASHWLALAGPSIEATAKRLGHNAEAWLKSHYGVDWQGSSQQAAQPELELALDPSNPVVVTTGETLNVGWKILNHGTGPANRVSVYVRSDLPGFETKEVLIGQVAAEGARSGVVAVPIPSQWDPELLHLRVGLAVDAWPAPSAAVDYAVQVNTRPVAALTAQVDLIDDNTGLVPGVLEGHEKARLAIDVSNTGDVAASDLKIKVVNLAGTQVQLSNSAVGVNEIDAGDDKRVFVDIQGARTLYSQDLDLGLLVESPDLKTAFAQRFTIKALPNGALSKSKTSGLTSH